MRGILFGAAIIALFSGCSTVDTNVALTPDSSEAVVFIAGLDLGSSRTGAVFRSFDPETKKFTAKILRVDDDGFVSDKVQVKDENGQSRLSRAYYFQKAKPGLYVYTTDIRQATALIGDSMQPVQASQFVCRRKGFAFPVLAGRVNIVDLAHPRPNDKELAAYQKDFAQIRPEFPNIQTSMQVSAPENVVEFFGANTASLVVADLGACPKGVSNYRPGEADDESNGGDIFVID